MASGITPIQRLQNAQQAADQWIQSNKPTQEQSEKVLSAFASRCRISGSDSFIAKINRIQKKASQMATGFNLMQRLLATGKEIVIRESEKSSFTHKTPEDTAIEIASSNIKAFYPYLNSDGERELAKASSRVTFLHEGLHALRHFEDPEAAEKRVEETGVLPEMDTAEEELVITGNLHLEEADVVDYCCENTALREINRPPHINHRGFSNNTPNLHDFVRHRILPKVRELAASGGITNEKISDFNALELAMHLRLLETDPRALQELNEIIALLIQGGCGSEYALKIAVLENSKEHIDLLLDAGIKPTSDIFQWASKSAEERVEELAKVLTAAKLMLDIEKLLETPTIVSPSGKNPLDKIFRQNPIDRGRL